MQSNTGFRTLHRFLALAGGLSFAILLMGASSSTSRTPAPAHPAPPAPHTNRPTVPVRPNAPAAPPAHPSTPAARLPVPTGQPVRPGTRPNPPVSHADGGTGIQRPPTRPEVRAAPGGGTRFTYANGSVLEKDRSGKPTHFSDPGGGVEAHFDPRTGRPARISTVTPYGRTVISRGPLNERRVEITRPVPGGMERAVHYGNWSSVERPIVGRPGYVQRTVVTGPRSYSMVYHSYVYGGVTLYQPVPALIFAPDYYASLLSPWPQPVLYTPVLWGWPAQPWYGYYAAAFAPYPVYARPDQWLTDYVISTTLQQAYSNQQAAGNVAPARPVEITEEEKAIIDQDVKDELARQQQFAIDAPRMDAAGNEGINQQIPRPNETPVPEQALAIPEGLKDHLFIVYTSPLEVQEASGGNCSLTEGDMLFRSGDSLNPDKTVDVVVKSSHAGSGNAEFCPAQTHARVLLSELQEMYNHKKELLMEGELQQAKLMGRPKGLPNGANPKPVQLASGKVDPNTAAAIADVTRMLQDADATERDVLTAATAN